MNADPLAIGAEIEAAVAALHEATAPEAAAQAQRLVTLLMSFYGAGLSRMLEIVRSERGGAGTLLDRLAHDPLVASLLALHELHPGSAAPLIQIDRPSQLRGSHDEPVRQAACELCAAALTDGHLHLVDVETRRLLCTCTMCSAVGGRYRVVPSRYLHLPSMGIAPAQWDALGIPVGLVFFVVDSHRGRTVACYPGPAGATESLLPLETWPSLVAAHPWMQDLAPDVEALLVRRIDHEYRCFIVPMDACYELVGRIRRTWTGFGGGNAVECEIDRFFAAVVEKMNSAGVPA
jgi:hypothetical protein